MEQILMITLRTADLGMALCIACLLDGVGSAVGGDLIHPRVVERPDGYARYLAFSPDHQMVAIAEEADNELRLVDFKSGRTLGRLKGHTNTICLAAFSPDGHRVATGGLDNTIRLWAIPTRRQFGQADVPRCISLAFSPDGRTLATGHFDLGKLIGLRFGDLSLRAPLKAIKTIETSPGRGRVLLPHRLRYASDGRWLAFGEHSINVLDVSRGVIRRLEGPNTSKSLISSYQFFDDKGWLVAANYHGELTVWDVASGAVLFHLAPNEMSSAVLLRTQSMARVQRTDTVLTGSAFDTIAAWDLKARKGPERSLRVEIPFDGAYPRPSSLVFSDDGSGLAVINEKRVYLLDVSGILQRELVLHQDQTAKSVVNGDP